MKAENVCARSSNAVKFEAILLRAEKETKIYQTSVSKYSKTIMGYSHLQLCLNCLTILLIFSKRSGNGLTISARVI